jgi:nucleoside-diphosphate-sugar epimerase
MQPVAVEDAAAAILAASETPVALAAGCPPHRVFDLVGPQPIAYREVVRAMARVARARGRPVNDAIRELPVAEAERRARSGGFQGMGPDTLDCLLCDEIADPAPLQALLGRPLTPLESALQTAVRGAA